MTGQSGSEAAETLALAMTVLRQATTLRMETFAGTALLGLQAIAKRDPERIKITEIVALATEVARDPGASEPCRITALRVASLNGTGEVLRIARELAQTGETEMLRMAAIASVGEMGSDKDQELLDALAHDLTPYVAAVARQAAATLRKRAEQKR